MNKKKFGVYGIIHKTDLVGVFIARDITNAKLKFASEIYHDPKPELFNLRCLGMYSTEQKRVLPTNIFIQSGYDAVGYKHTVTDLKEILKEKNLANEVEERKLKNEEIIVRLFDGVKIDGKD